MLSPPDAKGGKGRLREGRQPVGCETRHGLVFARAREPLNQRNRQRTASAAPPNRHFETPHLQIAYVIDISTAGFFFIPRRSRARFGLKLPQGAGPSR
jgi:hypothetical protein